MKLREERRLTKMKDRAAISCELSHLRNTLASLPGSSRDLLPSLTSIVGYGSRVTSDLSSTTSSFLRSITVVGAGSKLHGHIVAHMTTVWSFLVPEWSR